MEDCIVQLTNGDNRCKDLVEPDFRSDHPTKATGLYTLTGILEFLQSEWSRMEVERAGWAVERAEMQARIAFLKGECKAQENLKSDLVRRIKMLEHALIQERNKNFELKYPNESKLLVSVPLYFDEEKNVSQVESDVTTWEATRVSLRASVTDVGLDGATEQLRRTEAHDLISTVNAEDSASTSAAASAVSPTDVPSVDPKSPTDHISNFPDEISNIVSGDRPAATVSEVLLSSSDFDSYLFGLDDTPEVSDPETAEALAEFELLVSQQRISCGIPSPLGDSSITSVPGIATTFYTSWDSMDEKEMMARFKEKYHAKQFRNTSLPKEDRNFWRSSSPPDHQNDTEKLDFEYPIDVPSPGEDIDVKRPAEPICPSSNAPLSVDELEQAARDYDSVLSTSPSSPSRQDILTNSNMHATMTNIGSKTQLSNDASIPTSIGLGDLASLTVANESDPGHLQNMAAVMDSLDGVCVVPQIKVGESSCLRSSTSPPIETVPWTAKYTLRSHFDAIRCVKFHPIEPMLVTASEDHTLKLWNLNKTVQAKKSNNFDVEPIYTFRGHNAPVLSLSMITHSESSDPFSLIVFSGDLNGNLRSWRLATLHWDPYDTFDPTVTGPILRGHTDAIWSLVTRPDGFLLSASADGTACLWSTIPASLHHPPPSIPTGSVFQLTTTLMTSLVARSVEFGFRAPVPTSIDFVQTDRNRFITGFTSGHIGLFDIETNQLISSFYSIDSPSNEAAPDQTAVTCVQSHPLYSLAVCSYEDRHIRFFDLNSGKCTHTMVAHLDTVTSLAVDPHGTCLVSGSHDCSIRLWNISEKTCTQEITSHRKKFGESIHAVAFHPSKHLMASAGADALAKVFV